MRPCIFSFYLDTWPLFQRSLHLASFQWRNGQLSHHPVYTLDVRLGRVNRFWLLILVRIWFSKFLTLGINVSPENRKFRKLFKQSKFFVKNLEFLKSKKEMRVSYLRRLWMGRDRVLWVKILRVCDCDGMMCRMSHGARVLSIF